MPNFIVFYLIIIIERSFLIIYFPLLYSFLFSTYFCKLYFIDYTITVVPIFPPLPPSSKHVHSLRPSPSLCSCPWTMGISSLASPFPILYLRSPWLFCNCLFYFLIPSPLPPFPPPIWQPSKHSLHPWFCLCSCLLSLFLDSIVDRYVFIDILLFIVLTLFFLNKSL